MVLQCGDLQLENQQCDTDRKDTVAKRLDSVEPQLALGKRSNNRI